MGGGTPRTVTLYLSIRAKNRSRSKRGMVTTVAPEASGMAIETTKPMMWKKGATAIVVSRSVMRNPLRT
jgi:hypothetical protein